MTDAVTPAAYIRLLRTNRNVRLLWGAQVISEMGDWFYTVALYSLLIDLTGKAESVALALVCQVLPQFFFSPLAGVLNDHVSRKKIMIFSDLVRFGVILCMLVVRSREMLWLLYVLLVFETLMWALFEPARTAVIPNLTKSDQETVTANGIGSMTWAFTFFAGSSIGGLMAAAVGRDIVFVIDAFSFIASALLVRRMVFEEPHTEGKAPIRFRDLFDFRPSLEGFRYVRRDPRMFVTIFLKGGVAIIGSNWVILPMLGERVFPLTSFASDPSRAGMLGMSVMLGARGIGAIFGPLAGNAWAKSDMSKMRRGVVVGFLMIVAGYCALGFAPSAPVAILCIAFAHAGASMNWVFSTSMLHFMTEDKFRGRVFAADFAGMTVMLAVTSWIAGWLIDGGHPVQQVALWTGLSALLPMTLWILLTRRWW